MDDNLPDAGRRALILGTAVTAFAVARVDAQTPASAQSAPATQAPTTTLADVPLSSGSTITVERRGDIVLIGLNRQQIQNRLDPPMRAKLAEAFYGYEHDPSLRAA